MKSIENRLDKLEGEPPKDINIPIHKWVEKDRTDLEELTGIRYEYAKKGMSNEHK